MVAEGEYALTVALLLVFDSVFYAELMGTGEPKVPYWAAALMLGRKPVTNPPIGTDRTVS